MGLVARIDLPRYWDKGHVVRAAFLYRARPVLPGGRVVRSEGPLFMTRSRRLWFSEQPVLEADSRISRRSVFRRTLGGTLAVAGASASLDVRAANPDDELTLIVRNARPLDLETPVEGLRAWLTPNRAFFVRSHLGTPAVGLAPWRLDVAGLVDRPLKLAVDDLAGFEQVTVPAVLQCSGNGRAFFRPRVPGIPWERGAVGHAEWSGVRLVDLLERAGVRKAAAHVHLLGADRPPSPKTPLFLRSIPMAKARDPGTLVATRMNGEPLPVLQGGPMRLIVPGWTGNHWMKWLRTITVSSDEAPGFYMQTAYRMARASLSPGAVARPSDLVPVTAMNVKSLITWPLEGAILKPGRHEVRGVAWTGDGHVTRVEFAADHASSWAVATLEDDARLGSWRRWRASWDVSREGKYLLRARATDSNGQTQPETTPWNRSGYLWNGIDQVSCEIR